MSKSNDTCLETLSIFIMCILISLLLQHIVGIVITIIVIISLFIIIRKIYWNSLIEEERNRRFKRKNIYLILMKPL